MINKYITAIILAIISSNIVKAQIARSVPKLVINIIIDQLRTDYMEDFYPFYGENGFRKIMNSGVVCNNAQYSFSPIDRASSIASILTGTTPSKNGITGTKWFDKKSLVTINCVDDNSLNHKYVSPKRLLATTICDELKISTDGKAIVYSIAKERDAAVIGGGHAANGALWIDKENKCWYSSIYYFKTNPNWLDAYNYSYKFTEKDINANITNLALQCIDYNDMGSDNITDMLSLTYSAKQQNTDNIRQQQNTYIQLDKELEKLISYIENKIGKDNVLFVITSTGYCDGKDIDYNKYKIPSGTFYINRTANLLNMYLSAIYGQDKYIEGCFYNQIFLNLTKIELKRINIDEILKRAQSFLIQNEGVRNVFTIKDILLSKDSNKTKLCNWYNIDNCGDLIIEVSPGWKILNEENHQQYTSQENLNIFPIIFYGFNTIPQKITVPVTIESIAPTIAKCIRTRVPNACTAIPLF